MLKSKLRKVLCVCLLLAVTGSAAGSAPKKHYEPTVDNRGGWSYVKDAGFKFVDTLVGNLIDRVSKNGLFLLNVGPKADGTIPEEAKKCLLGIGEWLELNGEAIYDTTAWVAYGEGPTKLEKGVSFSERKQKCPYTSKDIRFTVKGNVLYAICLGWPEHEVVIRSVIENKNCILYESEIKSIRMLGVDKELQWKMTDESLVIQPPQERPCKYAYVFKIVR